eukprot:COSAG02_NODE_156_length_33065_cov_17.208336_13_plen_193_part_00
MRSRWQLGVREVWHPCGRACVWFDECARPAGTVDSPAISPRGVTQSTTTSSRNSPDTAGDTPCNPHRSTHTHRHTHRLGSATRVCVGACQRADCSPQPARADGDAPSHATCQRAGPPSARSCCRRTSASASRQWAAPTPRGPGLRIHSTDGVITTEVSLMIFGEMQRLEVVHGSQLYFSVSSPCSKRIEPSL